MQNDSSLSARCPVLHAGGLRADRLSNDDRTVRHGPIPSGAYRKASDLQPRRLPDLVVPLRDQIGSNADDAWSSPLREFARTVQESLGEALDSTADRFSTWGSGVQAEDFGSGPFRRPWRICRPMPKSRVSGFCRREGATTQDCMYPWRLSRSVGLLAASPARRTHSNRWSPWNQPRLKRSRWCVSTGPAPQAPNLIGASTLRRGRLAAA